MNIIVTGAVSGLGREIAGWLHEKHHVIGIDQQAVTGTDLPFCRFAVETDLRYLNSVFLARNCIKRHYDRIDGIVNCAGINHIDWLENLPEDAWEGVMGVNARAIFYMAQTFLPDLVESGGFILNIVSNASHMPMTGSLAYNASKAAAHMMTLQLARELSPKGITVFGISPNKLKGTEMSQYIERRVPEVRGWTPEYAAEYQRKSLLAGEETPPERVAEFIAFLLQSKARHKYLTGCILPYGA